MPTFSSAQLSKEALASESGRVQVWLIELSHESFTEDYYFASDGNTIYDYDTRTNDPIYCLVSNQKTYIATHFNIIIPDSQTGNAIPTAKLSIINASPELSTVIQDIKTAIRLKMHFVFADEPDEILTSFPIFYLTDVTTNAATIEATLAFNNFFDNVVPKITLIPSIFPGAFR